MRVLLRLVLALVVLVVLALAAAYFYLQRSLPSEEGEIRLGGLAKPVEVLRDAYGIPHIRAASLDDAIYALGFVHAQDRLWQMEVNRRTAAGRLAEIFGEPALEADRFLRTLGVRRSAEANFKRLDKDTQALLETYAAGVNAFVNTSPVLPIEFWLTGAKFEPWMPADSLGWVKMMAWDLGGNWRNELLRMRLAKTLPLARIHEFLPPYPGEAPLEITDLRKLYNSMEKEAPRLAQAERGGNAALQRPATRDIRDLVADARFDPQADNEGLGSNNWVVSGARSATGKPLLANDPHLGLTAPAVWYFAHIVTPGFEAIGATLPGVPAIVLGRNTQFAWGFTNTGPDVQDLYIERLHPADPNQVQTPDGWAPLKSYDETIRVRGKPDVVLKVRESRHGPLISDAGTSDDLLGNKNRNAFAIAMRWTALDGDVDTIGVLLAMNRATDVASFIEAAKGWVAPMQNMVVADRAGHIGYIAPGRVPLRKTGNDLKGLVPSLGWDARYDWDGWLAPDSLPQQRDPGRGWIATANQRIVPADYPHFLTSEWVLPYRQRRIEQLLEAKPKLSLDDLAAIQADVKSLAAAEMLPWLQRARSDHPLAVAAKKALVGFDGTMAADQPAPLILWAWQRHLVQQIFADEMGPVYERAIASRTFIDALKGVLESDNAWWCDDKTTPAAETCAQQIDSAFTAALDELQQAQGSDVSRWQWGRAHQARSEHRPFSHVKLLARWFELRTPVGGDTFTVNVSRVLFKPDATSGELYLNEHGPSLRALYDVADPKKSRFMHSTGQSGLPWSKWYSIFVDAWTKVEYVPLWPDEPPMATLTLQPAK